MPKPRVEWDPSWDDDWQTACAQLAELLEEHKPENPEEAVEYYRYGFSAGRRKPPPLLSDVESQLYEEYMSVEPETSEEQGYESMSWEQSREWTRRGWESSAC